ncbi:MAG: ubiquinol-cytochrome c reductase iron-sulfur subunit [Planctomycetota bacterium]
MADPSSQKHSSENSHSSPQYDRRSFLSTTASLSMACGLVAGYGTFAGMACSYLYPSKSVAKSWLFVAQIDQVLLGDSIAYKTPTGASVAIARQSTKGVVDDFIALSSTCPHLGCQVHWEKQHNRFFCPCHNGVFDPSGMALSGPPAEAGQSLPRYPLKIENGMLFIEVPVESGIADASLPKDSASMSDIERC